MRFKFRYFFIKAAYCCIDFVFMYSSIFLACRLREVTLPFSVNFYSLLFEPANPFRIIFLFWILTGIFCAYANRLYETKREIYEGIEIWQVVKCVLMSSLVVIVAIFTLKIERFPRSILLSGTVTAALCLSFWRVLKRMFVQYIVSQGYNNFNVLIIGAGKVGRALLEEIKKRPYLGLKVIGFLDDFKMTDPHHPEIKILGKISDFVAVARPEFINKIFITIHHDSGVFLQLLEQAKELGIAVRVIPQGFDLMSGDFFRYNIGLIPILEYCDIELTRSQFGKRFFDFVISLFALLVFWPILLLIGIIIKLDSPGPAIYSSKRYGRRGRVFNMYKFRSMVKNADEVLKVIRHKNEVGGPIFKMKSDPRITKVGGFLRKYSLDELPQMINVFKGEMSLVGPRPLPIEQVEREDLKQLMRLEVRPGITGLWQIRGRSDVPFTRLVKWDIWYINNWSFWLDLNILFQTIPAVFKCKGAY